MLLPIVVQKGLFCSTASTAEVPELRTLYSAQKWEPLFPHRKQLPVTIKNRYTIQFSLAWYPHTS